MNNKKLEEGDIFYVKIKDKFIFARLLIDIDTRILKKEPNHKMKFYSGCYLIEVYNGIYDKPILTTDEIIVPSQYTFKKYFYSKNYKVDWVFYEHKPIDYTKIDFPEVIETGNLGMLNFRKFDLSLPTKTLFKDFFGDDYSNQKYTGSISGTYYQMVDNAFHMQGRDDLMIDPDRTYFLDNSDLRLSPNDRTRFYNEVGEDENQSYYDLAFKYGFDLSRFY